MNRMVWVSLLPNGGWRKHKIGDKRLNIESQTREESIVKAREIFTKHKEELSKLKFIPDWRKWCGRKPFPPRS